MSDIEEIRQLAKEVAKNPLLNLSKIEPEKFAEVKKYINPLGTVTPNKKSCAVVSIFNMNEEYRKKLIITGLIGFIHRLVEEYEPEADLEKATKYQNHIGASQEETNERLNQITSTTRRIITEFFARHFSFNPDHHVLKGHSKEEVKANLDEAKIQLEAQTIDNKLKSNPTGLYKLMRAHTLNAHTLMEEASKCLRDINLALIDDTLDIEDKKAILLRLQIRLDKARDELSKLVVPLKVADTVEAWTQEPPRDVFYHFDRYLHNHYEQLREITDAVYSERADIDDIMILYDTFDGSTRLEQAQEFINQHEGDFKQEPRIIENNGITLLGPFKQNRDKVTMYNKNTQLLKEMLQQVEADHKLGKDLLNKRMKDKKKKNIVELGPDSLGLKEYRDTMSTIETLGAKKALTQKEQEEYAKAVTKKEDLEVPDGYIQQDVFFTDKDGKLQKNKIYTQAEAPLHLCKDSLFKDKYQPRREDSDDE